VNRAGFVIHSAIHMARRTCTCVLHTHTVPGQAVSALDCGLLPLNQAAMRFYNHIGYHDFEGIAQDWTSGSGSSRTWAPHKCLIMRKHGLLTAGADCGEAFHLMFHLVRSCETQLARARSRTALQHAAARDLRENGRAILEERPAAGDLDWPAQMKLPGCDGSLVPQLDGKQMTASTDREGLPDAEGSKELNFAATDCFGLGRPSIARTDRR
jgi:ribulose-5-phosphate 4-epimerase/fuculose-1-phosphate aldolase